MTIYDTFVYWIHLDEDTDISTQGYVGVTRDPKRRFRDHLKESRSLSPKNLHLARALSKYYPKMTLIFQGTNSACYELEHELRPARQIGWNIQTGGKIHDDLTIQKRSLSLKGRIFTDEWKEKISISNTGEKNGMYGKKYECPQERKLAMNYSKNKDKFSVFKNAILLLNEGIGVREVGRKLNLSPGVVSLLNQGKHGAFNVFPELKELLNSTEGPG